MKQISFFLLLVVVFTCESYSQDRSKFELVGEVGANRFAPNNNEESPNLASLMMDVGANYKMHFSENSAFLTGIHFGVLFKSDVISNFEGPLPEQSFIFKEMDLRERNSYNISLPLEYVHRFGAAELAMGILGKLWLPAEDHFLGSQFEHGLNTRVNFAIQENISAGFRYYHGLNSVTAVSFPESEVPVKLRGRSATLSINYHF